MERVLSSIEPTNVTGALDQDESIVIDIEGGEQYAFTPRSKPRTAGDDNQVCSGMVILIIGGQFVGSEQVANLYFRRVGTDEAYSELDILTE